MAHRDPNPFRTSSKGLCVLALVTLWWPCPAVWAQTSPYYIGGSQSLGQESNLLGLANNQRAPAGYSKSDTLSTTSLLGGVDQRLGRQRLYGTLALRANRYARNRSFDNEGYNLAGGWDWSTIERLSGTVNASANRGLVNFNTAETGVVTRKNIETVESLEAVVRWGLVTQYTLEGVVGRRKSRNSLDEPRAQVQNNTEDRLAVGLRWRPSSATNLGLALRGTKGDYPNLQPSGGAYQSRSVDLSAAMQVSGASSVDAVLSVVRTRYDTVDRRDFSGVTGNARWVWQPTGKLRFDSLLSRSTGQDDQAVTVVTTSTTSSYKRVVDTLRLRTDYDLSAKTALSTVVSHSHRDLVRTIESPFIPLNASGRENIHSLSLGLRWAPSFGSSVGCDASADRREGAGELAYDVKAARFSCYVQLTLQ